MRIAILLLAGLIGLGGLFVASQTLRRGPAMTPEAEPQTPEPGTFRVRPGGVLEITPEDGATPVRADLGNLFNQVLAKQTDRQATTPKAAGLAPIAKPSSGTVRDAFGRLLGG